MNRTKVLLVEDHSVAREALTRLLRYEGYEATCASNGVEALAAMTNHAPDILLLDLMLPKLNGVALLKQIRGDERLRDLPVIVMTASVDHAQLAEVRGLGVRAVLSKAKFTLDELLHLMRLEAKVLCEAAVPT